jgi:uncharacterized protein
MLAVCLLVLLAAASQLPKFSFDASADTLVVEGDPELLKYNKMSALFGGDDFVVLTYTSDDVFTRSALLEIDALQQQLDKLDGVESTFSILDAPLIESPPIPLELLAENYRTLRDPTIDLHLAQRELTHSPIMNDYLISRDSRTTAISATLVRDSALESLRDHRDELRRIDSEKLESVEAAHDAGRADFVTRREALINELRQIRDSYGGKAHLFISGVPVIAADMLSYVRSDLMIFGALIFLLIVALLTFFFRKPRWVVIPLSVCIASVVSTMGILGVLGTPVTVVSSNFISLLSIISISFSIHLIVRYWELMATTELSHADMVRETMHSKFTPCLYTALTTLLAFGAMLGSRIVPIIDFGWMMCLGIVIALLITYSLFPALLLLLGPTSPSKTLRKRIVLTDWFEYLSTKQARSVIVVTLLIMLPALWGLSMITFDNRFIDYFSDDTDIYRGMSQIDRHLGGTLPLDVYVRFEQFETGDDDFFDEFEEPYPERYWFTPEKIEVMHALQRALEARPEIGKVISLASLEQMAQQFNDGEALEGIEIAYVLGELPEEVRALIIDPYARPAEGWMRLNARIRESVTKFSKDELIKDIRAYGSKFGYDDNDIIVTGMVVLFNDMLKQLAESQARTLSYVLTATFIMFSLLLRSLSLALIALIPNVIAAGLIISLMGFAGIAMDMMTITIAAICIGIGVDDAIHYLHRFRQELVNGNPDGDSNLNSMENAVESAVVHSHRTIGHAMYFTTMTVMGGFSILAFSNFIPTVYFGLLTALAMALALVANMTLLPSLLIVFYRKAV